MPEEQNEDCDGLGYHEGHYVTTKSNCGGIKCQARASSSGVLDMNGYMYFSLRFRCVFYGEPLENEKEQTDSCLASFKGSCQFFLKEFCSKIETIMTNLNTLKSIALALSIIIVLNAFINIGVKTFYPAPEFEDFCSVVENKQYKTQESCEAVGGKWIISIHDGLEARTIAPPPKPVNDFTEYCDSSFSCRAEFQDARELYDRNVFIILVIAGLLSLGIGYRLSTSEAVSSGFVFGGVISFIIGVLRYWSNMNDYSRFIILGVVLIILIWIGYRKLNKSN